MRLKNLFSFSVFLLVFAFAQIWTLPAGGQELYPSKKLAIGDSSLWAKTGGYSPVHVELGDSSDSRVDTFKVYVGIPKPGTLATDTGYIWKQVFVKVQNDTNTTNPVAVYKDVLFPGDGAVGIYEVLYQNPAAVKIVRVNSGGGLTGNRPSWVSIKGIKKYGSLNRNDFGLRVDLKSANNKKSIYSGLSTMVLNGSKGSLVYQGKKFRYNLRM